MTDARRAILLLGAGPDQCPLIHAARRLRLETVVVDQDPGAPGLVLADHAAVVSTRDVDTLVAFCRDVRTRGVDLRGVSVIGSDIPHVVAALAHAMGWAGPSRETAALATHKRRMRERFVEAGVATPRFAAAASPADVAAFWERIGCEAVVVKPVDQAGSRGVRVVSNAAELNDAFADALAAGGGEVLAEEFIEGPQVSTETLLTETHALTPGFADRNYEDTRALWPRILENGGWMPTRLDGATQAAVRDLVVRGARALGISRGVAKGDVVIDARRGPMLIELAARLGGGDFAASLVPLSSGVDYLPSALRIALGEEPDWNALRPTRERVVANRYFFLPAGRLEEVRGIESVRAWPEVVKLELFVAPGEDLRWVTHHGARAGVLVVAAQDRARVDGVCEAAYASLSFCVDGRWCSGRASGAASSFVGDVTASSSRLRSASAS